jgi:hypothetical protein
MAHYLLQGAQITPTYEIPLAKGMTYAVSAKFRPRDSCIRHTSADYLVNAMSCQGSLVALKDVAVFRAFAEIREESPCLLTDGDFTLSALAPDLHRVCIDILLTEAGRFACPHTGIYEERQQGPVS